VNNRSSRPEPTILNADDIARRRPDKSDKSYENREVSSGRRCPLPGSSHVPKGLPLTVSVGSCSPPCVCEGFEVCVHLTYSRHDGSFSGRCPIWPVLSASSMEEAREISSNLRKHLRDAVKSTKDPSLFTSEDFLKGFVAVFAKKNNFVNAHHIVWKKDRSKSDS
jgi:hypothetical protein